MVPQQRQVTDVLVEAAAHTIGNHVAQQPAGVGQQQGFPELQRAVAGHHADGEEQGDARYHDAGDGQAFDAGDQEDGQAQPFRIGAEPGGDLVEPLTHGRRSSIRVKSRPSTCPRRSGLRVQWRA
ncbi:hypothetical protein D9M72_361820 [compost metagenome]